MSEKVKTKKTGMIKTLLKSVRQYKKPSLITPIFMLLEALCECLIPFIMAKMITAIDVEGIEATVALTEIGKHRFSLLRIKNFKRNVFQRKPLQACAPFIT